MRCLVCINLFCFSDTSNNTIESLRVRKGVAAENPKHYTLDEKELGRVSALARIELEDARAELERANEALKTMGRGAEGDEADDMGDDGDQEDDWVE